MNNPVLSISIAIPTKNRHSDIIKCIKSILNQDKLPLEIIVIDSSDDDELRSRLKPFERTVPIVYSYDKISLTKARNQAVEIAQGEIILFLDDDTIMCPDYLSEVLEVFEGDAHGRIGGVSGSLILPGEYLNRGILSRLRKRGRWIIGLIFFLNIEKDGKFRLSGFPTSPPPDARMIIQVECLYGANMAFRTNILKKFRFDESFVGYSYMEDDDIAYRVSREYQNMYTPFAQIIHNESPASRDRSYDRHKMLLKNHYYLFKKNFPQDGIHLLAFILSIVGLIVVNLLKADIAGVRGLFAGLKRIPEISAHLIEGGYL